MDWTKWNQGLKREYDGQEHDRAAGGKPTEGRVRASAISFASAASPVDSLLHDASATAAAGVPRWFYLSSDMCLIASAVHSCWVNCNEPPPKKAVVYLWLVISGVDNPGATESVQAN